MHTVVSKFENGELTVGFTSMVNDKIRQIILEALYRCHGVHTARFMEDRGDVVSLVVVVDPTSDTETSEFERFPDEVEGIVNYLLDTPLF